MGIDITDKRGFVFSKVTFRKTSIFAPNKVMGLAFKLTQLIAKILLGFKLYKRQIDVVNQTIISASSSFQNLRIVVLYKSLSFRE